MGSIRDILRLRQERPDNRDDHRVALCIRAGAMKGALYAGMAEALSDLGLDRLFDDIYGSSAGAITAGYLANGNAGQAPLLYTDVMAASRWKFPMLATLGLFDAQVAEHLDLDPQRIADHPAALHPLILDARSRAVTDAAEVFDLSTTSGLLAALRASVRTPWPTNRVARAALGRWRDAGLREAMPLATPIRQGATHLLLLGTGDDKHTPSDTHIEVLPVPHGTYRSTCRDHDELRRYTKTGRRAVHDWWARQP